jgi:flagellar hook-length control protein FliK
MALTTSSPTHAQAHATAAHATAARGAPRAGAHARPELDPGAEDEGGGFAAQLMRAQPSQDADADVGRPAAGKGGDAKEDKDEKADADVPDAGAAVNAAAPPADPNAAANANAVAGAWPLQAAPSTASLAARAGAADAAADGAAADPLAALRKGAGRGREGKDALVADLGTGKDARAAGAAGSAAGLGAGRAGEFAAALGKGDAPGMAAGGEGRDPAALMSPVDQLAVQPGAIGASPDAALDAGAAAPVPTAQATLPMPPHSPAFAPALGHQIDVWIKDGVQHAHVELNPQDLGPIRVKIEMSGDRARVEMAADVASTRDALQQALPQLSAQLGQVGLSLDGGSVFDPSSPQSGAFAAGGDGADGGKGGGRGGRDGGRARPGPADDAAAAGIVAARAPGPRRGLLDMYA